MDTQNTDKINVVGKSTKDLSKHYKKINGKYELGLPELKDGESYSDLQKMVGEAQKAMEAKVNDAKDAEEGNNDSAGESEKGKEYVFLKSPAYVNAEERIAGGFYHINLDEYSRLKKAPANVCVIYGEEMPARELTKVADWFGVTTDKLSDEELLEKLTTEPTLY